MGKTELKVKIFIINFYTVHNIQISPFVLKIHKLTAISLKIYPEY